MQVVILAAGTGSRLKDLTTKMPKALIEVAGRPLIDYSIRFAKKTGAKRIIVVGGFYFDNLNAHIIAQGFDVAVIQNPDYLKGNILTLTAAMPHLDPSDGCLIMNTDHIYKPTIAGLVEREMRSAQPVTAFCDFDRQLGADDMKVRLDVNRRVSAMAKTLERFDCGYVGMTLVPGAKRVEHQRAISALLSERGDSAVVEEVLATLANTGHAPNIADISGHGWLEVDEPHEREMAESVLHEEHWWG